MRLRQNAVGAADHAQGDPGVGDREIRQPAVPQRPVARGGETVMRWDRPAIENLSYWTKALGVALSFMMFMVWQHVQARHMERQLNALRKEEDQLIYQNARLQSQIN